jgi:glutamate synthase (NADPH/NADH) small chain
MAGKVKRTPKAPRQAAPKLDLPSRVTSCSEVALSFTDEQARAEALRCLDCVDPKCIEACPLHINIKGFIERLVQGDGAGAYELITAANPCPSVCGRICQHELYCEKDCLLGKKLQPVAIGNLERYVGDVFGPADHTPEAQPENGLRVALAGSGPASLMVAKELRYLGYGVTIFEALHDVGGVLTYGIPPFRLPREVLHHAIDYLRARGVEFRTDVLIGKTIGLQELFWRGYCAVFVGTGAGLPAMLNIPGENSLGVYTANEFLTRLNLMEAFRFPAAATPIRTGKRTVVVGGGNSAMDCARWARRLGSEVTILFRRGRAELRARLDEIEEAEHEGIAFHFLAAPVEVLSEKGAVRAIRCIQMELGGLDSTGRPAPVPIPGSEFEIEADTVVAAVGVSPNPTVQRATPELRTEKGKILIDECGLTNAPLVFAGGDVVRGGSTVILAMRDGRTAAKAIHEHLRNHRLLRSGNEAHTPLKPNRVAARREMAPGVTWLEIENPEIARVGKPGHFVIVRPLQSSERMPLTLVETDPARGTIVLVVQSIGKTSTEAAAIEPGHCFADILGPLGQPATIAKFGTVLCVGGGVGVAELLPVVRAFRDAGNRVISLCGARSRAQMIFERELAEASAEAWWATEDGSKGHRGNVLDLMRVWRAGYAGEIHAAHVIGPIRMMEAVSRLTGEWNVRTFASLNPIMIDGTGMCGGCRVLVGGHSRFACVDGPEFDAHEVNFADLAVRNSAYLSQERAARDDHQCRIRLGQNSQA